MDIIDGHIISHRMENRITGLLTGNAKVDSNTNTNTSGCPAPDIHLNDNDYDSTTTGVVGQNCTDYEGFGNRSIVSGSAVYAVYEVTSGGQENQLHYFACYSGDGACGYFNGSIASTSKLKVEGWSSMSGWLVVETDTF